LLCHHALMAEVSATPKPGLVDQHDSGAHSDMDFDTFAASSDAIAPWITRMFETGLFWPNPNGDGLFPAIRTLGIEAEKAMFEATGGVNTHKGMIFSMGIIAAAAGFLFAKTQHFDAEAILETSGRLCRDLLEEDFQKIDKKNPRTHGEILYVRFGVKGIRGEAAKGFPSIREIALPALRRFSDPELTEQAWEAFAEVYPNGPTGTLIIPGPPPFCPDQVNDQADYVFGDRIDLSGDSYDFNALQNAARLNTLLSLMAEVDDTNVLIRTGPEMLLYEKEAAKRILDLGGAFTRQGLSELSLLNEEFIRLHLSPGGCADLLAVTILLHDLENLS
ncbi:triphosphoribosyl-dephospho-CoA synthase, partial [Brotaphodocola sp.]|uniref:triphosphoribosyl-dephospho-CoA synthase n=1 Tax=Brotaphodocola sp. TaxID=3073577 RepID=UPI003D7CC34E